MIYNNYNIAFNLLFATVLLYFALFFALVLDYHLQKKKKLQYPSRLFSLLQRKRKCLKIICFLIVSMA